MAHGSVVPQFAAALAAFGRAELDADPDVIFGLSPQLRLAYFNQAWYRYAADNGGEPAISRDWALGRPVLDAVPPVLLPFYQNVYATALALRRRPQRPLQFEYDCSTPQRQRRFGMSLYPLGADTGLLVVNSMLVEHPRESDVESLYPADPRPYRDGRGRMHQCANCRRMRNLRQAGRWDWVPGWVQAVPPAAEFDLCPICFGYYYAHVPPGLAR